MDSNNSSKCIALRLNIHGNLQMILRPKGQVGNPFKFYRIRKHITTPAILFNENFIRYFAEIAVGVE